MTIVAGNDPRILTVEVTDELISAHLADGRTISAHWRGRGVYPMPRLSNASILRLSGPDKASTGQTLMRTLVPLACSLAPRLRLRSRASHRRWLQS